jgi:hypothetical protein
MVLDPNQMLKQVLRIPTMGRERILHEIPDRDDCGAVHRRPLLNRVRGPCLE